MGEQIDASNSTSELTEAKNESKGDAPKSVTEVFEEIKQKGASSSFINNHKAKESIAVSFNQFETLISNPLFHFD